MSLDILQPLSKREIPKLLEVLGREMPESAWVINWIKTQCKWGQKLQHQARVLILCPYGDFTSGTVIAFNVGLAHNCRIFGAVYSSQKEGLLLKKCLDESDAIPWRALSDYVTVGEKHAGLYLDALRKRGLQIKHQTACVVAYMPPGDAAIVQTPKLPDGAWIEPLDAAQHMDAVWAAWPHYHADFKPVMQLMLELSPSFGVFHLNDPNSFLIAMPEAPVAVLVHSDSAGLGALQTLPSHRRKGLACALLAHATRAMAATGVGPHAHLATDNHASVALFDKVGYKIVARTRWISLCN